MKTICITGTNRGIGLALSKEFLQNGWFVIGTTRKNNPHSEIAMHPHYQHEQLDVLDSSSIQSFAKRLHGQPIDILINNAGIFDTISLSDPIYTDSSTIAQVYLTNTVAPHVVSEALLGNIRAGNEKLIIAISSLLGTYQNIEPHHATHWIYGSSKAGLNYAMNAFAISHPDIKISLIRPGWTQTDMGGAQADLSPDQAAKIIYSHIVNYPEKLVAGEIMGPDGSVIILK